MELDNQVMAAVNEILSVTRATTTTTGTPANGAAATEKIEDGEPKPERFRKHCEVCDVYCPCDEAYELHLKGAKHAKVLRTKAMMGGKQFKSKNVADCWLASRLKQVTDPMVGLQHVVEFQPASGEATFNNVWYYCNMCKCKLDAAAIINHIIGMKHRQSYLRKNYVDMSNELLTVKAKQEKNELCLEFVTKVAQKEGMRLPSVQVYTNNMQDVYLQKMEKDKETPRNIRAEKMLKDTVPSFKKAVLESKFKEINGPIIGLENITEFQPAKGAAESNALRYYCDVCAVICDISTIKTHLVGMKHRRSYIMKNHPEMSSKLSENSEEMSKDEYRALVLGFAQTIASKGRKKVRVQVEKVAPNIRKRPTDDSSFSGPGGKRHPPSFSGRPMGREQPMLLSGGRGSQRKPIQPRYDPSPAYEAAPGPALMRTPPAPSRSSRSMGLAVSMDRMIQLLETTAISTEEEAELALELSNRLTQELLEFRKKTVPGHMFEKAKVTSGLDDGFSGTPGSMRGQRPPAHEDSGSFRGSYYSDSQMGYDRSSFGGSSYGTSGAGRGDFSDAYYQGDTSYGHSNESNYDIPKSDSLLPQYGSYYN